MSSFLNKFGNNWAINLTFGALIEGWKSITKNACARCKRSFYLKMQLLSLDCSNPKYWNILDGSFVASWIHFFCPFFFTYLKTVVVIELFANLFSVADGRTNVTPTWVLVSDLSEFIRQFLATICKIYSLRAPESLERIVGCFVISTGPDLSKPCNIEQQVRTFWDDDVIWFQKLLPGLPDLHHKMWSCESTYPTPKFCAYDLFWRDKMVGGTLCPTTSQTHNSQTL